MDDFPKLISGPDEVEGAYWAGVSDVPRGFVAHIPSSSRAHPDRQEIMEEMVRRYNAHDHVVEQIEDALEYYEDIEESEGETNHPAIAGFMRGCLRNALEEAHNG